MSVSGAYDDGFEDDLVPPRESALICWPVEFLGGEEKKPAVSGLHCTVAYWPEIKLSADQMLDAITKSSATWQVKAYRHWRIANVKGVAAFGELNDYPVLTLEDDQPDTTLTYLHDAVVNAFRTVEFWNHRPDGRFTYNPHVSVDLKTIVDPPKQLVLRPLELWYKDEKPVII